MVPGRQVEGGFKSCCKWLVAVAKALRLAVSVGYNTAGGPLGQSAAVGVELTATPLQMQVGRQQHQSTGNAQGRGLQVRVDGLKRCPWVSASVRVQVVSLLCLDRHLLPR